MERIESFNNFSVNKSLRESFIAVGFGPNKTRTFSISAGRGGATGYDLTPMIGKIDETLSELVEEAYAFEKDEHPDHKGKELVDGIKEYVDVRLDELYEECEKSVNESTEDFNPGERMQQLKRRAAQNRDRYKDAQERQDNYAIKYYELRMRLDKLDEEKAKLRKEIKKLKDKFGKFKK